MYGYGEFSLVCPEEFSETMTCSGLGEEALVVETSVVTPEPEVEEEVFGEK